MYAFNFIKPTCLKGGYFFSRLYSGIMCLTTEHTSFDGGIHLPYVYWNSICIVLGECFYHEVDINIKHTRDIHTWRSLKFKCRPPYRSRVSWIFSAAKLFSTKLAGVHIYIHSYRPSLCYYSKIITGFFYGAVCVGSSSLACTNITTLVGVCSFTAFGISQIRSMEQCCQRRPNTLFWICLCKAVYQQLWSHIFSRNRVGSSERAMRIPLILASPRCWTCSGSSSRTISTRNTHLTDFIDQRAHCIWMRDFHCFAWHDFDCQLSLPLCWFILSVAFADRRWRWQKHWHGICHPVLHPCPSNWNDCARTWEEIRSAW